MTKFRHIKRTDFATDLPNDITIRIPLTNIVIVFGLISVAFYFLEFIFGKFLANRTLSWPHQNIIYDANCHAT